MADLPEATQARIRAMRDQGVPIYQIVAETGLTEYAVRYLARARSREEQHRWNLARQRVRSAEYHATMDRSNPVGTAEGVVTVRGLRCPTRVWADSEDEARALLAGMIEATNA